MPIQKKLQDRRSRKNCAVHAAGTEESRFLPEYTLFKDDRVQAMVRLRSAFLLTILALAAMPAAGQQPAKHNSDAGVVAVVGDIENCNTFPVPASTALTVRQAVINAGLLSESVNVTVIRAAQDHAHWTQVVSAASADNGEPVESGDVLVVKAMSPLSSAVRKNAALRTNAGVVIVALEQDGIVIGDVLQATNNLPPTDGQLKFISRFPGKTTIARAELYDPVVHGDVISISSTGRTVIKDFGSMTPTVSEWKSSTENEVRDPFISNDASDNGLPFTSSPLTTQPSQAPESSDARISLAIPNADLSDADTAEPDAKAPAAIVPTLPISQSEDVADENGADNKMSFASESTTVAPIAPPEIQIGSVTSDTTSAFNPWNLVFIGGLLLAGTLILAGTLKPEPDDNTEFSKATKSAATLVPVRTDSSVVVGRKHTERPVQQDVVVRTSKTAVTQVANASETVTGAVQIPAAQSAKPLIGGHEWFSSDWHGPMIASDRESRTEASIPVSASGFSEEINTALEFNRHTTVAEPPSPTVSESESVQVSTPDEQGFSDLEDLLQNRLPIDLRAIQLPVRVTLFGKPSGPRRLRIDAAHSAMPAPHINLTLDKRREQPVVSTSAAAHATVTHSQTTADSSGSLDRALHFLQERTEL